MLIAHWLVNMRAATRHLVRGGRITALCLLLSISTWVGCVPVGTSPDIAYPEVPLIVIGAGQQSIAATLDFGGEFNDLRFELINTPGNRVHYMVHVYDDWLWVTPDAGYSEAEVLAFDVHVDRTGLPPGDYQATLDVVIVGIETITIALNVSIVPGAGGATETPYSVNSPPYDPVGADPNDGGGGATDGEPAPDPNDAADSPTEPGADPNDAPDYPGEPRDDPGVPITDPNDPNEPPAAPPVLSVSPLLLSYELGAEPQTLSIRNTGGGTLAFSVVTDTPWIVASPNSGEDAGDGQDIVVSIDRTGLYSGDYAGELSVITTDGQSADVSVTMSVYRDVDDPEFWSSYRGDPAPTAFGGLGAGLADEATNEAFGISAFGAVVVGRQRGVEDGLVQGAIWHADGTFELLGAMSAAGVYSHAFGTTADGDLVVGHALGDDGFTAFAYTATDGFTALGDLPGGEYRSGAYAVSANGRVVVGFSESADGFEAFSWTATDGMIGLGDLPGGVFESCATGVSGAGDVIVGYGASESGDEACYWTTATGLVPLGFLEDGARSQATGISVDGTTIVGYSDSPDGRQAFVWTGASGMVGLGDLPGGEFQSTAYAVSGDGQRVVGAGLSDTGSEAFVWDEAAGMRSLAAAYAAAGGGAELAGWQLERAVAISADGQVIVGQGINPTGQREAWRITLPR